MFKYNGLLCFCVYYTTLQPSNSTLGNHTFSEHSILLKAQVQQNTVLNKSPSNESNLSHLTLSNPTSA